MRNVPVVDAMSTIMPLMAIEAMCRGMRVDNARYHHAKLVQAWLAEPGRRIKPHFIPACCPHLNPIERLWRLMHKHITHGKSCPSGAYEAGAYEAGVAMPEKPPAEH